MKTQNQVYHRRPGAFTLMELLIVISIIAILAALIFPVGAAIKNKAALSKAKSELTNLIQAIEQYKMKYGYYPPDHTPATGLNPVYNSLYFELVGSERTGIVGNYTYTSLDGAAKITEADCLSQLGTGAILNAKKPGDEEAKPAEKFLPVIKPGQYYEYTFGASTIRLLKCSVPWPEKAVAVIPGVPAVNPFRYVKNGINNAGGFDLWVDVVVGGKTNRISNWSSAAETVYY